MAKCPKCGAENPDYSFYCGKCSSDLRDSTGKIIQASDEVPAGEEPPPPAQAGQANQITPKPVHGPVPPRLITCAWCGRQVNENTLYCPFCGKNPGGPWKGGSRESDYTAEVDYDYEGLAPKQATGTLVLGGIMAILAGVLALGQGLLYAAASSLVSFVPGSGAVCFCGGLDALFGIGSIVGGVLAVRQTNFSLALAGAIVGMLGLGFLIGGLFGLIALICIAVSRQEFND